MTRSVVSRMLTTAAALAVLSTLGSPSSAQDSKTSQTLYARVGGYDFIARFVDTAFPRVAAQPQLADCSRVTRLTVSSSSAN